MPESKLDPAAAPRTSAETMFWSDRPEPAPATLSEAIPIDTSDSHDLTYVERSPTRSGAAMVALGVIALVAGVAATTCSHDAAVARGGGEYFVFTGAIAYGLLSIVRGLFR